MLDLLIKNARIVEKCLLFACCLCLLTLPVFAGDTADVWDGTVAKPTKLVEKDGVYYYEISTCEELAWVAQEGGDWLTYNYLLVNDLILNETPPEWDEEGICTNSEELLEWTPIGGQNEEAIFSGILDGAGNLIEGLYIDTTEGCQGLIGDSDSNALLSNITVQNSYVKSSDSYIGGLVGSLSGRATNYSYEGAVIGEYNVGGVAGYVDGKVDNCVVSGYIVASEGHAGGVAGYSGYSEVAIQSCMVTGTVKAANHAGGLIGHTAMNVLVQNCNVSCNIIADTGNAGGLIGNGNCDVYDSVALGKVLSKNDCAGGLIGAGKCDVNNFVGKNSVIGCNAAGGLVGSNSRCNIAISHATGDVTATNGPAGGLIGEVETNSRSVIENCYALGNVSASTYAGGLVGRYSNTYTGSALNGISNCYSAGAVLSGENRGGFLGEDRRIWGENFTIENCYFLRDEGVNEDLFGTSVATADVANEIEGKMLDQLKDQSTFAGWDFGTVWAVDPGKNDGLPYLWPRDGEVDIVPMPQYRVNSITPRDLSGATLDTVPEEEFLVTLSVTKLAEDGEAIVLLACYTEAGQYRGLLYVRVKGLTQNAELELTLPVDNSKGEIAQITAFTIASFDDWTPLSEAVTFE